MVGLRRVPRSRAISGGMASAAPPDVAAAMAVYRQDQGAGAFLGPEESVDDDVLSSLSSASFPTHAVIDAMTGRYPWITVRRLQ